MTVNPAKLAQRIERAAQTLRNAIDDAHVAGLDDDTRKHLALAHAHATHAASGITTNPNRRTTRT